MPALYLTPAGYTDRRPTDFPKIDRAALMRDAHRLARQFQTQTPISYREALRRGLCAAWASAKVAQTFRSLRAQVAPVQHTAAQIEASRQATRRTGSSLWAS